MSSTGQVHELDLLRSQVADLSRQLAEQDRQLHEQTRHLRNAQAMAHLGSWEWEVPSGRMVWSDELYDMLGQTLGAAGVTYDTFLAALLPDDHDRVLAVTNAALAGTAPFDVECRIVRPDGEVRIIHCRGEIRRDEAGQPIVMSGIALDITDRTRAELALKQSEARFRALIEHSSDIITVLGLDGTIQFESPSFERLLGYSQHELNGRIAFEFVHPDDLPTVIEKFQLVIQQPQEPQVAAFRFRHKNGSWLSLEGIGRSILDTEGRRCVIVNSRDITERKRVETALRASQEKLQQALHASSTGLWDWNTETNEVSLSREWKRQLGYDEAELPDAFETWEARLHPDDHTRAVAYVQTYLAHPEGEYQQEFRLRHKDGTYRWIETRASLVTEPNGRRVRLLGSHTDITARKRTEEALRVSQERYARATAIGRVGVWELDVATGTYHGDVNLKALFGYEGDELSTDPYVWLNLVHPDDQAIALDRWQRIVSGVMDHYSYELRMIRKDGTVIWTDVRGHAVRNREGQVTQLIGATVDITDRKRTQEALVKSERQLRTVLDALPLGVWFTDQAGTLMLSNPASHQIWSNIRRVGLKHPTDPIGWWESLDLAGEPHRWALSHALTKGGASVNETLELECVDGTTRTIRNTTVPVRNEAGVPLGALVLNEDISSLRQAEAALKLTQFSVDRAVEGFLWISADGRILNVNQAACRMLEYLPDELTAMTVHDIDPKFFPQTWAAQWEDLKRKGSLTFESKHWSKTGRVLDTEVSVNYLCYEGLEYNCIIMRDISDRKRAEGELRRSHAFIRQVIDAAPSFIFAKDRTGRFTLANKAVADCYGTTVEELIDKTDADFNQNREEVAIYREIDREVLDSLQDRYIPEEAITDVTGRIRWLQTVKRPIFDDQGLPTMVLGVSTEITERKRAEETLRHREQDLRHVMEERERISQDLHDGILQSLYAVGLGLEACRPLLAPPQRKKATAKLTAAFDRAIGQLNHVMAEVRNFIAGLESQVLQGGDFATALQAMVQTMSASSTIACRVSIEEAAVREISTEQALHLMNVMREALSNSLRHSRAKQITVSLKPLTHSVRLSVTDDGVGFNPAISHATGHGLANMAARARKIGGRFALRSAPRRGTRILLDLPREPWYARP